MEKTKEIGFKIYNYIFNIVKTSSINKSRKKRDKDIGNSWEYSYTVGGLHSYNGNMPEAYIFLEPKSDIGVIVHECYHGIMRMFRYIGVEDFDEEIVAYHLEELVKQVNEFIK